ncbi:MAG: hypothetical protein QM817_29985 [Archangium sp.]
MLSSLISVTLACVGLPICAPQLPPAQQPVPVNAVALVGFIDEATDAGTLTLVHADGGTEVLPRIRVLQGEQASSALFAAPTTWEVGEEVTLRGDVTPHDSCTRMPLNPSTTFTVAPSFALPTDLGTLVLGPPVGFSNTDPSLPQLECDATRVLMPGVTRTVSLQLTRELLVWVPLARLRRDGAKPFFGHLAGRNAGIEVGSVSASCEKPEGVKKVPIALEFEIAGVPETVKLNEEIELDCTKAGPRVGCSAAPVSLLVAMVLLFVRRRR